MIGHSGIGCCHQRTLLSLRHSTTPVALHTFLAQTDRAKHFHGCQLREAPSISPAVRRRQRDPTRSGRTAAPDQRILFNKQDGLALQILLSQWGCSTENAVNMVRHAEDVMQRGSSSYGAAEMLLHPWKAYGIHSIVGTYIGLTLRKGGKARLGEWMVRTIAISGEPLAVQFAVLWAVSAEKPYRANDIVAKHLEQLAESDVVWEPKVLQGLSLYQRGDREAGFRFLQQALHLTKAASIQPDDPFVQFRPPVPAPWEALLNTARQFKRPMEGAVAVKAGAFDFDVPDAYREFAEHKTVPRYSRTWQEFKSKAAQAGDATAAMDLAEFYLVASGLYPTPPVGRQISSRQALKRSLGLEWLRISAAGEVDSHMKAKKTIFAALLMRHGGEPYPAKVMIEQVVATLKEASRGNEQLAHDLESAERLQSMWSSLELRPEVILDFSPSKRLRDSATTEMPA